MYNQPGYRNGFTLIELMITIAIAAILLGIAIPSFTSIIVDNRLTTSANELVTALNLARSEAVKRGIQVTVQRKGATSAQWESGWDVFVDSDGSNAFNDDGDATLCEIGEDCLLRTYTALPSGYTLRTGGSTYENYAAYLPSGLSKVVAGDTFRLCKDSGTTVPRRTITINATGRLRVATTPGTCP
jgi:type IV fimbrial biogenesis protein FimT